MKNEKNYVDFHIPKIWQILKRFARRFHQAQTTHFGRVREQTHKLLCVCGASHTFLKGPTGAFGNFKIIHSS